MNSFCLVLPRVQKIDCITKYITLHCKIKKNNNNIKKINIFTILKPGNGEFLLKNVWAL